MIKCKCGVELFDCDCVDKGRKEIKYGYIESGIKIYRCPKCFKIKKVKE